MAEHVRKIWDGVDIVLYENCFIVSNRKTRKHVIDSTMYLATIATIATMAQTPGLDTCGPIYFAEGVDSNGAGQIQLLLNGTYCSGQCSVKI